MLVSTFGQEVEERLKQVSVLLEDDLRKLTSRHMESLAREFSELHEVLLQKSSGDLEDIPEGGGPISSLRLPIRPSEPLESEPLPPAGLPLAPSATWNIDLKEGGQISEDEKAELSKRSKSGESNGTELPSGRRPSKRSNGSKPSKESNGSKASKDEKASNGHEHTNGTSNGEEKGNGEDDEDGPSGLGGTPTSEASFSRKSSMKAAYDGKNKYAVVFVQHKYSELFFSICIILNCATMGIEADGLVRPHETWIYDFGDVIEQAFCVLFFIEIVAKLYVYGWRNFLPSNTENTFNFMDLVLVMFTGVFFSWIIPLLTLVAGEEMSAGALRTLSVFRAVRLLRIVRVIQKMPMFREVWLLLKGLTDSLRTLFWTVVVIFSITYIFAIFGCWIISFEILKIMEVEDNPERLADMKEVLHFVEGIGPLMALLVQFLTLDSWNSKMERIQIYAPQCVPYFYLYISVAVFVLMNLVTAIIVENAMSASKMDEDQRLKQMESTKLKELKELEALFNLMDENGDGTLDWDEFEGAFEDEEMTRKWRLLDFQKDDCKELFDVLDDGDGGIDTGEFFYGLSRMKGTAQSRDLMRVNKNIDRVMKDMQTMLTTMQLLPQLGADFNARERIGGQQLLLEEEVSDSPDADK